METLRGLKTHLVDMAHGVNKSSDHRPVWPVTDWQFRNPPDPPYGPCCLHILLTVKHVSSESWRLSQQHWGILLWYRQSGSQELQDFILHCSLRMMWSWRLCQNMTSSVHWGGLQPCAVAGIRIRTSMFSRLGGAPWPNPMAPHQINRRKWMDGCVLLIMVF